MGKLLKLARLHFLSAGLLLYLFGALWAALSGAPFSLPRGLLGYLVVFCAQLSISFSNDYFDVGVDALGKPTLFSGGSGVLVAHASLRKTAQRIALGLIVCSLAAGAVFALFLAQGCCNFPGAAVVPGFCIIG